MTFRLMGLSFFSLLICLVLAIGSSLLCRIRGSDFVRMSHTCNVQDSPLLDPGLELEAQQRVSRSGTCCSRGDQEQPTLAVGEELKRSQVPCSQLAQHPQPPCCIEPSIQLHPRLMTA